MNCRDFAGYPKLIPVTLLKHDSPQTKAFPYGCFKHSSTQAFILASCSDVSPMTMFAHSRTRRLKSNVEIDIVKFMPDCLALFTAQFLLELGIGV